jgi:uncharacterized protein (TIGR00251 family)
MGLRASIIEHAGAVTFDVKVQPRARRERIVGLDGGRVKIALTAPPVDGAANEALVAFLATALGVPRRDVEILRGKTARLKTVRVTGVTREAVVRVLAPD